MIDIANPVCAVLGAGPGNGAAIAQRFAKAGHRVALMARDASRLSGLVRDVPGSTAVVCDAGEPLEVERAFVEVEQRMGPVETLVYNAGSGAWGDALSISTAEFEANWRVNALGAFVAARQVLPGMRSRGTGAIIFIGATASRRGGPKTAAFAPAKAAQRALAESLARSYGPDGVHVALLVIDAVVDLPGTRASMPDKPDDFFIKPADIAETAFMLARQPRSAWTFELELRPFGERW